MLGKRFGECISVGPVSNQGWCELQTKNRFVKLKSIGICSWSWPYPINLLVTIVWAKWCRLACKVANKLLPTLRFYRSCSTLWKRVPKPEIMKVQLKRPNVWRHALTSNWSIRWQSSTSRLVPSILIVTDSLSFSSNLTVAAEWNTIETVLQSVAWSCSEMPSSSLVMSPWMGTILSRSWGRSFRSWSKRGPFSSSLRRVAISWPRFGRISK